ncbi:hypothetical protein CI238_01864 [Colletotrichum incanum]|uniref:Uncharacterized protein n=1 Tax=Colletotrichum incanum TaxID=1573173 RepID=A0A161W1G7_COLIC|nr:hypothetical protein CI238_01864 [Colletotrichum incanum]
MDRSNKKSRSGGKTSGQGRKDTRPESNTPLPSSTLGQQQQVPHNLAQYIESDRRTGPAMGQPYYSSAYSPQFHDDESSRRSWNSAMGSAGDTEDDRYDDPRSNEVASSRQQRREYASRLPGPPPPPKQRPTPEEEIRAYERALGRQLHTTMPAMDFSDQFGYQPSTSGYASSLELDYSDALSNDRTSGSSQSKGHNSRRHDKRRHN